MDESTAHRPSRAQITDLGSSDDPAGVEEPRGMRVVLWLVGLLTLGAVLGLSWAYVSEVRSRGEKAAIRSAVAQYAGMFREPEARVYKYGEIRAQPLQDGAWAVRISRVIIPDRMSGYRITSLFEVDRDGTTRYIGQQEGRGD